MKPSTLLLLFYIFYYYYDYFFIITTVVVVVVVVAVAVAVAVAVVVVVVVVDGFCARNLSALTRSPCCRPGSADIENIENQLLLLVRLNFAVAVAVAFAVAVAVAVGVVVVVVVVVVVDGFCVRNLSALTRSPCCRPGSADIENIENQLLLLVRLNLLVLFPGALPLASAGVGGHLLNRQNAGPASLKHHGSEGRRSHQIAPKNCLTSLLKS